MITPATALPATIETLVCNVCGGSSVPHCSKRSHDLDWSIRRCTSCGHGFVSNRPSLDLLRQIYSLEKHTDMGEMSADALRDAPEASRIAARIAKWIPAGGRSLDVGCGNGAFSYHLALGGFKPLMIDLDPRAEKWAALVPNSSFRTSAFEEIDEKDAFDAIIMSQVLEHSLDPLSWLSHARKLLKPRGILAVAVPNFSGVYRLLGARDPFLIPPLHLNYFTPDSMQIAFEKAGLTVVGKGSVNRVNVGHSLKTRLIRGAWNVMARPLDLTVRGIILHMFGTPKL